MPTNSLALMQAQFRAQVSCYPEQQSPVAPTLDTPPSSTPAIEKIANRVSVEVVNAKPGDVGGASGLLL